MKRFSIFLSLLLSLGFSFLMNQEINAQSLFQAMPSSSTGITFENTLPETPALNIITYEYFYNGGGVGVGDFNKDGLIDIFFSSNISQHKLYLNKGNFQFEDITKKAGILPNAGWATGVSVADVNGDGWLDIYLCQSGNLPPEKRKNLLYINNKDLTFTEMAVEVGLADAGHTTMAAFFDMDKDGDLDAYILNHNIKQFRNFDAAFLKNQIDPDAGDRLYENRNGIFHNITQQAGIKSNPLGYGLGLNVSDIDGDGWQDIYVSNDYVEEDYLYLNNQNGTFREVPKDNKTQKLLYAPDNFEVYNNTVDNGFHHQLMRNMLHLNNGNGTFSEIGQLAGISNTDWSWSALFADYNNDGKKDLFVTNGYGRDMINRDFIKFYANERLKHLQGNTDDKMFGLLQSIKSTPLQNFIFENEGEFIFKDRTVDWGLTGADYAHGAAYADVDNDGDLDLIFNRMNAGAGIYKNNTIEQNKSKGFILVELSSKSKNTCALGAKVKVYTPEGIFSVENNPVHGFQSSISGPVHIGLSGDKIDSIKVTWPSGNISYLKENVLINKTYFFTDSITTQPQKGNLAKTTSIFNAIPDTLNYTHKELMVNDFKVQPLIPNMISYHGPETAVGDINGDGLEDFYISGPERQAGNIFLQLKNGQFIPTNQPALLADAGYEDTYAVFFDADGDKDLDLYVVSGGYGDADSGLPLKDRLYLNQGGLFFAAPAGSLPDILFSGSVVVPLDVDLDGDVDLFVGARVEQGKYPYAPESIWLENNGKGTFTIKWRKQLGMITHALALDIDMDGQSELVVCGEWTSIQYFSFKNGECQDISNEVLSSPLKGWWNILHAADLDGDGDKDLIAGNWGLNAPCKASEKEPIELYYDDFDKNGYIDPVLCYYMDGISYPFSTRDEMTDQMVGLRKKFVTYDSYANVTIQNIFTPDQLSKSPKLEVNTLETIWLENVNGQFVPRSLPAEANFSPVHAILTEDFDGDGSLDILLAGNVEYTRIRIGKTDANYGVLLKGSGKNASFTYLPQLTSGLSIKGAVRSLKSIQRLDKSQVVLIGINNQSPLILKTSN
jgi:enediyne biosynthesis protein E4